METIVRNTNNLETSLCRKSQIISNLKSIKNINENNINYICNKSNEKNNFKSLLNNKQRSDAITEFELIYDKLKPYLNDDQLLDRAERRDLPFRFQNIWGQSCDHNNSRHTTLKSDNDLQIKLNSDNSYEAFNKRRSLATIEALLLLPRDDKCLNPIVRSRTPSYRRSAVPDIITDDFAFRKYNKSLSHNNIQEIKGFNTIKRINNNKNSNSMSYLLIIDSNNNENHNYNQNKDLKYLSTANVKFDDVMSRRLRQSFAANVLPPHPPFGIPNNIVSHSSPNDYVRAELDPKEMNKVRFRYRSSDPHLIHDDMAFRNLRQSCFNRRIIDRSSTSA